MKVCARTIATLAIAVSLTPLSLLVAETGPTLPTNASAHMATSNAAQDSAAAARRRDRRKAPKAELFLGYSRFGYGINPSSAPAGNRMVWLNGGSAAFAFNLNRYLGLVGDFGGYDANQLLLTGTGTNQSFLVNADGKAYTYVGGPRISFRNASRFTPFAQVLAGGIHATSVTVSGSNCSGSTCTPLPVQNAFAMTAGLGLDIRLTQHLAIRAIQAEYMMTRFDGVPSGPSSNQNNLRLSSGLVFSFGGGSTPEAPVSLACSVEPSSAFPGDPLMLTATPSNLNPKHPAIYRWSSNSGVIAGTGTSVKINTVGVAPGTYTVSGHVSQGSNPTDEASCNASFTIQAQEPPTILCSASPATVAPGGSSNIRAQALSPQNHPLTYSYSTNAGTLQNHTATAVLNTAGVAPGVITVTCNVVDDLGKSASATTTVTIAAPAMPAVPEVHNLCEISFTRDRTRPRRVDNEAKACLDEIALEMQHDAEGRLVVVGGYSADEKPEAASERAANVRHYLTTDKGIDAQRIELRVTAGSSDRTAKNVFVPQGATYPANNTMPASTKMSH